MHKNTSPKYFICVVFFIGLIFLRAGIVKISSNVFTLELPHTLSVFEKGNPNPIVKDLLKNAAIPNYYIVSMMVIYGEIATGITLLISSTFYFMQGYLNKVNLLLLTTGLAYGFLMNGIYLLSSGWMSPASETLNVLMLFISFMGFVFIRFEVIPDLKNKQKK